MMKVLGFNSGFWALALTAALLQGCSGGANTFSDASTRSMTPGQFTQVAQPGASSNAKGTIDKIYAKGAAAGPTDPQEYKIGPLDVLDVAVLGVTDMTRTVQVTSAGTITMPLIKTIKASGRTQAELERDITERLSHSYLQNPQVTVGIKEYNSQKITVDGAVAKPGIFPLNGQTSLSQAIAQAQGLTTSADPTGVLVFRTVNGKRQAARFDIRQVRSGKMPDPMMLAGDIVEVDESAAKSTLRDITSAMPLTGLFAAAPLVGL